MSEDSQGETSQKRPGSDVEIAGSATGGETSQNRKKNRRNRRRKRKRDQVHNTEAQNPGSAGAKTVQPDTAVDSASGRGNVHPAQGSKDDNPSSDLAPQSQSKRSRRRRNRRKNKNNIAQDPAANSGALEDAKKQGFENRADGHRHRRAPSGKTKKPNQNRQNEAAANKPIHRPQRRQLDAYAALDLGTNNCRLLVAVPQQPGRFRVVDAFSRIVRLGEGLGATGRLSDAAMDRAVGALKACADKLNGRKVKGVRLIATEACRRATNGEEFLKRVEQEAGLSLEIINRETEARLAVAGCSSLVDRKARGVVLFDIGGGSSELALLDLNKRKRHDLGPAMVSWTSMPFGVVTLSEKHGGGKMVTRDVFQNMVDEVSEHLETFEGRDALVEAAQNGEVHLLGTSGTVTTLAGIHLKLPKYDRRRVDGTWMVSSQVTEMIDALVDMSFEQRVQNPCIGHDRADLVLAGCAILVAIQNFWPCERLRVADRGLREGLLTEMMNADNAWLRRFNRPRHRNTKPQGQ